MDKDFIKTKKDYVSEIKMYITEWSPESYKIFCDIYDRVETRTEKLGKMLK